MEQASRPVRQGSLHLLLCQDVHQLKPAQLDRGRDRIFGPHLLKVGYLPA